VRACELRTAVGFTVRDYPTNRLTWDDWLLPDGLEIGSALSKNHKNPLHAEDRSSDEKVDRPKTAAVPDTWVSNSRAGLIIAEIMEFGGVS
jgi:hypothetical protein